MSERVARQYQGTQTRVEAQACSHVTFAASSARWLRAPSERRAGDVASFSREDQ